MSWLGAAVLAVAVHAQDFTQTMTAEERAAAGLEKLSPAELAKLKAAVERYKAGEVAVVQQRAQQQVAATEAKVKAAEEKAAVAEAKAKSSPEAAVQGPSWLKALITLEKTAQAPDASEALVSKLKGNFEGWRRGTVFTLENGQRWQVISDEDYVTPTMPPAVVTIKPGALGTYWMRIEGVRSRVKVKPLKLE